MKNSVILSLGVLTLLAGCQYEELYHEDTLQSFDVSLESIISGPETKTYADAQHLVVWHNDDRVSVFEKKEYWEEYKYTGRTGTTGGKLTKLSSEGSSTGGDLDYYYAVYPHSELNGFDNRGHLLLTLHREQPYDEFSFGRGTNLMVSSSEDNTFKFKNIGGYLVFKLYGEGVSVSSIRLTGNSEEEITGDVDVEISPGTDPVTTMSTARYAEKYNDAVLVCDPPVELGATASEFKEFWFVLPPMTFTQGFSIEVTTSEGEVWTKTTQKPWTISRNHYTPVSAMEVKMEQQVDTAVNLSENGTANCYIVPAQGKYKFEAVKGNSSETVGDVKGVKVLWESFGDDRTPEVGEIIKTDASYSDGYILFSANDSYVEGNAVIAAFSDEECSEGNVLWSWHLWVTSADLEGLSQTYNNGVGVMMDRNLGAISNDVMETRVNCSGMLYQWGRKDPFISVYRSGDNKFTETSTSVEMPSAVDSDQTTGTIDYSVSHPDTFIKGQDWLFHSDTDHGDSRWALEKTIYDPCPVGYKVPESRTWFVATGYDGYHYGFNQSYYYISLNVMSGVYVRLPYSMSRDYRSGQLFVPGGGYDIASAYWASDVVVDNSYYDYYAPALVGTAYDGLILTTNCYGYVSPPRYSYRGTGNMVRCISESSRPIVMPESLELDSYAIQIEPREEFDLETLNPRITPPNANVTSVRWSTSDSFNLEQLSGSVIRGRNIGSYKAYCYSSLTDNLMKECSVTVCPYEPSVYYNGGWYLHAEAGDTISFTYYIGDDDDGENYFDIFIGNTSVYSYPYHYSTCSGTFTYTFEEAFTGWFYMDWGWGCNIWDIETTATVIGRGEVNKTMDDSWKQSPNFKFEYKNHQLTVN